MKRSIQNLYYVIFAVLVLCPLLFFSMFKKYIPSNSYENRKLAEFPTLSLETIRDFPSDFESWLTDHLPFKSQLVTLNGFIDYTVFHTSSKESVLVGKEGWLYFKGQGVQGEDPIGDYQGTDLYSQEDLDVIRDNVLRAQALLAERGCQFYIYIAPNKERMYSEYMPDAYGEPNDNCRMLQVVNYLNETTDVTVICPYYELLAYKQEHPEKQIYYKYDTHWNMQGAYLGTCVLDEVLGYEMPSLDEVTITTGGYGNYDLATQIGLRDYLQDDNVYTITGYTEREVRRESIIPSTCFRYYNEGQEATDEKVVIIGDSFSTMMGDYLACNYNNVYLNSYINYESSILEEEKPEIFIFECVERYINNLYHFDLEDQIGIH